MNVIAINMLMAWSLWFALACNQLIFALPGVVAIGAYTSGYLDTHGHESLTVQLVLATVLGAAAGLPLGLLACRLRGFALAIATVGISDALILTVNNVTFLGGAQGIVGIFPADHTLAVGLAAVVVLAAFSWRLFRSRWGRVMDLVSQDELQAAALGVRVAAVKIGVVVTSSAVAAFAGALSARYSGVVLPDEFDLALSIQVFAFVALGGIGSFWGPLAGAAFLTYVFQELAVAGAVRSIVYGAVIVLVMLVRREGLLARSAYLRARWTKRRLGDRWTRLRVPQPPLRGWSVKLAHHGSRTAG